MWPGVWTTNQSRVPSVMRSPWCTRSVGSGGENSSRIALIMTRRFNGGPWFVVPHGVTARLREGKGFGRPLAETNDITLHNEVPTDLPEVEADREELIRLFTNLVSNAVKYNTPGGRVTVTGAAEGPFLRLSVADTGIGISEEGLAIHLHRRPP